MTWKIRISGLVMETSLELGGPNGPSLVGVGGPPTDTLISDFAAPFRLARAYRSRCDR